MFDISFSDANLFGSVFFLFCNDFISISFLAAGGRYDNMRSAGSRDPLIAYMHGSFSAKSLQGGEDENMYSVLVCKRNAQAVIMQRLVVMGTEVERD
jgi:hypothetical protein